MTVLFHTLGCKLNFAESSAIGDMFAASGIRAVTPGENPDYIVVNTCTVTGEADKKCRQVIRSLAHHFPQAKIIVTGCYAQMAPDEVLGLPGVSLVAGNDRKERILEYLKADLDKACMVTPGNEIREFHPLCAHGDRTRYFLKVQDGCNYFCSYCAIPFARGRSRSASIETTLAVARRAVKDGARELVITGVNTGDFGHGTNEDFLMLCNALDSLEGIERFRISSIEPNLLTDSLIDFVAGSRHFMPHFHIPLQSGDDHMLRLMRRRYDSSLFASKIDRIRRVIPHAFIGVDLITGMRGETEERFKSSRAFVEGLDISRLHVFSYSERPGTRALEILPVVSQEQKHRRTRQMIEISDRKLREFSSRFVGQTRPVLAEHCGQGFTDNYLRVQLPPGCEPNTIVNARLDRMDAECTFLTQ